MLCMYVCMYINVTITILDTIRLSFKIDVSETAFSPRLQVEPTQLSPVDRDSLCLRATGWIMSRIFIVIFLPFVYHFFEFFNPNHTP
jgi:hypothetical protein